MRGTIRQAASRSEARMQRDRSPSKAATSPGRSGEEGSNGQVRPQVVVGTIDCSSEDVHGGPPHFGADRHSLGPDTR